MQRVVHWPSFLGWVFSVTWISFFGPTGFAQTDSANAEHVGIAHLDATTANAWATMVLKGIDTEYPNKMSIVLTDRSQIKSPQETFPAFYGCFDWHSSVHGHWLLVRLLRTYPEIESANKIRAALDRHLTAENLRVETEFFAREEHKSFERMYGWAWLMRLVTELQRWDNADAQRWRENLRPLEEQLAARAIDYLPLLTYPIRTGEHTDTGFALGQLLDYAIEMDNQELAALVRARAVAFYSGDVAYPVNYEPSGHDFFSSGWNEADLMRRVLPPDDFATWLAKFLPELKSQLADGTIAPVQVSDLTDGKLVHLAGLNLNRAWCMRGVASELNETHPLRDAILESADSHLRAGLSYINSGHYEGDHWLATFGLYAITHSVGSAE